MFNEFLFLVSALLTIGLSLAVLFTKNIMHACIYLLGTFIGVAGLYLTLGAELIAATQIMIYMGGVIILMVFAVMLTGGKDFISRAQEFLKLAPSMGNKKTYAWGFVSVFIIAVTLFRLIRSFAGFSHLAPTNFNSSVAELGYALVGKHVLAFEISSILLLGALIGAAIIARPKKKIFVEEDHDHT